MLQTVTLKNFKSSSAKKFDFNLSYQIFGAELFSAPIVLVNHALTGNSNVAGENGWWKTLIGDDKVIDTKKFTVLCFNIPGNGFDDVLIENYQDFTAKDIAKIFLEGLKLLKIKKLHTIIGGSLGGAIGWEMLGIQKNLATNFVPVACDFKTSDWLHAQCLVQKFLLSQEHEPIEKARIHAMLCYRTPESLNFRFKTEVDAEKQIRKSHDWLNYHGKSLSKRFSLQAYLLMNHLLMTIDTKEEDLLKINAEIHLIAVDSDLFFPAFEICCTHNRLVKNYRNSFFHEIKSIHGHDAFLMEYEQLNEILKIVFK